VGKTILVDNVPRPKAPRGGLMDAHAPALEGYFPAAADAAPPSADTGPREAVSTPDLRVSQPIVPSFTRSLLAEDEGFSPRREAARFGIGLGLAAVYGLSLGTRSGGKAFFTHALFVPAALAAVVALGVPALYISLALFDAPIEPPRAVAAAARATARTGLVLAGLAPAAALFVVSSDDARSAAGSAIVGLVIAGAVGLTRMVGDLHGAIQHAPANTRAKADFAFFGFAVFAVALAARIWWAALPLLRGVK
jgi:hypothetical protein